MTLSAVPMSGFVGLELPKWSEMFATKASAALTGSLHYTISFGEAELTGCSISGIGGITIPSSVDGYPVTSIGDRAFQGCEGLTSVTISNSIVSIGDYAFSDCTDLMLVKISDSVVSIGDHVFGYCVDLKTVTIGKSVRSIGDYAFENCTSLARINWNAVTVNDFSYDNYVFDNAGTSGDGIDVVFGDNVESIPDYAFGVCYDAY